MKSQDIVILLKLVSLQLQEDEGRLEDFSWHSNREDPYSVRGLEASLKISKTEVNASINRSLASGLAIKDRERGRAKPNKRGLFEFIVYGLKYAFPAKPGAMVRGMPTAFGAPMLREMLMSGGEELYVWPYAKGKDKGQKIEPLFKTVPEAVIRDERLYEYLALVDAIRLGRQREAGLAADHLEQRLLAR